MKKIIATSIIALCFISLTSFAKEIYKNRAEIKNSTAGPLLIYESAFGNKTIYRLETAAIIKIGYCEKKQHYCIDIYKTETTPGNMPAYTIYGFKSIEEAEKWLSQKLEVK